MRTFLTPLRRPAGQRHVLRNERTQAIIADELLPAFDSETRRTGLLKHTSLGPRTAMVIAPTNAIHTFFMKFPIDVAFVAKDGRIVKIARALPAWRLAAAWGAYAVVEMAAGAFSNADTHAGDTVSIVALAEARPGTIQEGHA